ncbi:MAG: hypothetical protein IPJ41_17605 [Phycisphaerales bacterium]|nr:hypothetical protein [Phycisphaerales bacterium]
MTTPPNTSHGRVGAGAAIVWAVIGIGVIAPAALAIIGAVRGMATTGFRTGIDLPSWHLVLVSLGSAAGIAALAVLFAWPVGGVISRARAGASFAAAGPMLLPMYLAYAGWSVLRAPTTPLGKWIGAAPEHGWPMLPVVVGRGLAIWGLALWAWPLAAITIAVGVRSLGPEVLESFKMDARSRIRRTAATVRAVRHSIGAAWLLVFLLMLGSAVPLQVALIPTIAVHSWEVLDQHPTEPWRAWIAAWPLILAAVAAGWVLASPLARAGERLAALGGEDSRIVRPRWTDWAVASGPWILALAVPFLAFAWSMGSFRGLTRFLHDAHDAILSSGAVAASVALLSGILCLAAAHATSGPRGARHARTWLTLSLVWALVPGVLVGSAIAQFVRLPALPRAFADTPVPVVIAHLARFAFLPLLVGTWLSAAEARAVGDMRRLDGAVGLAGWAKSAAVGHLGPALAVALAAGCLSLHEIEASIQVQPPGIEHLAQRVLQWLHYERMTELSAASVLLLGIGMAASAAGMVAARAGRGRTKRGSHR